MTNPSEPEAVGTTETVLKPCPFCGELPLLINGTWLDTGGGDGARRWGVECLNDDCVVRPISVLLGPHGYRRDDDPPSNADAKAEAIAAWNTRAPSSAPEVSELVEALEEIINPIPFMERRAKATGNRLSGMAYSIANDVVYLRNIALAALAKMKS